ncbi:uncharacterized protein LOC121800688 [Salvia splendens]|uniref:uncharacterized protein LOC121800688 n=1 Tax=Salvia splendens TaxID=180675 RepID=UPI001C280FA5|nr:uncharacterized protein LOC121800688 [Salvia splendens]
MHEKEISLIKSSIKPSMHEKKICLINQEGDGLIKPSIKCVERDGLITPSIKRVDRGRNGGQLDQAMNHGPNGQVDQAVDQGVKPLDLTVRCFDANATKKIEARAVQGEPRAEAKDKPSKTAKIEDHTWSKQSVSLCTAAAPISVELTDANFLMWQQQVDVTAYGYGLEGFMNREKKSPPQTIVIVEGEGGSVINDEFISWQRQDRRVAAWLLSSLSEGALGLVVGLRSARDICSALETNFASRSTAKIMQYRQQMQNLKKDSLTMSEYIGKMRNCFDLLGSVGCRVSEDEQVMHILGGLGQEYDPAVCAISSRSDSWSLGDDAAFLLTFESRMETMRSHSSSTEGSQPLLNLMQPSNQKKDFTPYNTRFDSGSGRCGARNQR